MNGPTRRNLTFNFQRAINVVNGQQVAQTIEVAITPLATPSTPGGDLTYVGGLQEQSVVLSGETNTLVFALVPSNAAGLTQPLPYLASFRQGGITGATTTQPFAMPDADTDWDDLPDLGDVISGVSYVQQADVGVAGGLAELNEAGQVVDVGGNPVAMPADLATVSSSLSAEATARISGDAAVTTAFESAVAGSATSTLGSAKSYTDSQIASMTAAVASEAGARANAINALTTTVGNDNTNLQGQITTNTTDIAANTTALGNKADKDGTGHVPIAQVPVAAITNWISVASQTAMKALTYPAQVQLGDIAYYADSGNNVFWVLIGTDPTTLASWKQINTVISVNGQVGDVVLTAANVGAIATGASITQSQVTGLSTALGLLASSASLATLQTQVTGIANDSTIVHTSGGAIADSVMPADAVFINGSGNLAKKNGDVITIGSGSGVTTVNGSGGAVTITPASIGALATSGTIAESQVTGLSTDLANRVLTSDSRLTNARTPTAHASTHAAAGSDPITITQAQVTGLTSALAALASASSVSTLSTTVSGLSTNKADLVSGTVPLNQMSQIIPISYINGLTAQLANMTSGAFDAAHLTNLANIPSGVPITSVTGLSTALTGKADLSGPGGTVNPAQLPPSVLATTYEVSSQTAMLALTSATQGDICVITTGANLGTYILNGSDPTTLSNWVELAFPGAVASVNGATGVVTVTPASIGAIATGASISQSQVTGLTAALATFVTTSALSGAVATQVQTITSASTPNKQNVNFVATSAIPSLVGQQTVDGTLVTAGTRVLATAQPSSVNNGIWVVASPGAWTRPTDFGTGSYLLNGSLVVVTQGSANANTLWQETSASGVVDTAINNWSNIGSVAGQSAYTQGNGIAITGTQIAAKVVTSGGLQVASGGLSINPAIGVMKATGTVPSGSAVTSITHNLNTLAPWVVIVDTASGNIVDLGVTVTNANVVSCEFGSAPASGQYRYAIYG